MKSWDQGLGVGTKGIKSMNPGLQTREHQLLSGYVQPSPVSHDLLMDLEHSGAIAERQTFLIPSQTRQYHEGPSLGSAA